MGVEQKHWMRVLPMVGVLKMKCQLEIEKHKKLGTLHDSFLKSDDQIIFACAGAWFCNRIKHNHL